MKKLIFALFSILLLLASCVAPQTTTDTQIPYTPEPPVTITPVTLTDIPIATTSSPQPGIFAIIRLQMINAHIGWAEGSITGEHDPSRFSDTTYYLLRTTDGGESWRDVTPPLSLPGLLTTITLFAIDADTAWAIPAGFPFSDDPPYVVVWSTTDGGKSWKPSNPIDISDSPIRDAVPLLEFVAKEHGWLTLRFEHRVEAYYLEFRTSDGGISWEQIGSCSTYDGDIVGRCAVPEFTDAQTGWRTTPPQYTPAGVVDPTSTWRVERTLDGGQTWQTITLPHAQDEKECNPWPTRVAKGIVGIFVQCYTPALLKESYYYLSADRGETWSFLPQPEGANVVFLDMTTGWRDFKSDNGYQLEKTTDGGTTWQKQADCLPAGGFQFVDANTGWEEISDVSDPFAFSPIALQRTADGGKTWQRFIPRFLPADPSQSAIAHLEPGHPLVFQSTQMVDSLNGWAIGANGYIFHTQDGGKAWRDITPLQGSIAPQRELFALNAQRAWTTVSFPAYQAILSTTNGGQSWQQIFALSEGQVVSRGSLRYLNESVGWFQSSQGGDPRLVQLMTTRDQGVNWEPQLTAQYPNSYAARDQMGFMFLDEQNGFRIEPVDEYTLEQYLKDTPVLISKTTDGGVTWQPVELPNLVFDAGEVSLDGEAHPSGIKELMQDPLSCDEEVTLRAISLDTIGLRVICRGAYRDVYRTYGYVFVLGQYFLSTDSGSSWNNWMPFGEDVPREDDKNPIESEFFLPGGIGWRLKANQLLKTKDGGKTWTALKAVGWDEARLDFINEQEGWGIVKSGTAVSLVHTADGGRIWEELQPFVGNE